MRQVYPGIGYSHITWQTEKFGLQAGVEGGHIWQRKDFYEYEISKHTAF